MELEARDLGLVLLFLDVSGFYQPPLWCCFKSHTKDHNLVNNICLSRNPPVEFSNFMLAHIKHSKNVPHNKINWYFKWNERQTKPDPNHTPDVVSLYTIHISGYPLSLHYLTWVLMTGHQEKDINLHDTMTYAYEIRKLHRLFSFLKNRLYIDIYVSSYSCENGLVPKDTA